MKTETEKLRAGRSMRERRRGTRRRRAGKERGRKRGQGEEERKQKERRERGGREARTREKGRSAFLISHRILKENFISLLLPLAQFNLHQPKLRKPQDPVYLSSTAPHPAKPAPPACSPSYFSLPLLASSLPLLAPLDSPTLNSFANAQEPSGFPCALSCDSMRNVKRRAEKRREHRIGEEIGEERRGEARRGEERRGEEGR
eukprot:765721-Hanusia_phi.AAC.2